MTWPPGDSAKYALMSAQGKAWAPFVTLAVDVLHVQLGKRVVPGDGDGSLFLGRSPALSPSTPCFSGASLKFWFFVLTFLQ